MNLINVSVLLVSSYSPSLCVSLHLRCPLSGWLWSASTTGSSLIRVTCGVTVGGGQPMTWIPPPIRLILSLCLSIFRSDHLGADDFWRQAVRRDPHARNPRHPRERGAPAPAAHLHHRRLHGHGQMWEGNTLIHAQTKHHIHCKLTKRTSLGL